MIDITDVVGLFPEAALGGAGLPAVRRWPASPATRPQAVRRTSVAGMRMKLEQRCHGIELVLADVDGVLTPGEIVFNNQGIETKQFHIRDGMGIRLWQRAGYKFGVITGRSSHIVKIRAAELGVEIVRQTAEDKLPVALEILGGLGLEPHQVCYIGDDLPDLPVMRRGAGRGRGRRLQGSSRSGALRHRAGRRPGRGSRNDRNDPQGPRPLGRPDSKIYHLSGRWLQFRIPPAVPPACCGAFGRAPRVSARWQAASWPFSRHTCCTG